MLALPLIACAALPAGAAPTAPHLAPGAATSRTSTPTNAVASAAPPAFVVPAGAVQFYDTDVEGTLFASDVILESGSRLIVRGTQPLLIVAEGTVQLDGWIEADGGPGLNALHPSWMIVPYIDPWPGPPGVLGSGPGGASSEALLASTAQGGSAPGIGGGQGGASGFAPANGAELQLGANGGGGRFALDAPAGGSSAPLGLAAQPGRDGAPTATSAVSGTTPPEGGQPGSSPFVDGDPSNDFFGFGFDAATGQPFAGELQAPRGGFGGGAGGDAILSGSFPLIPWTIDQEWQGGSGGSGGGLVAVFARRVVFGPGGGLSANGGWGGKGAFASASQLSLSGCGGGGSGGMILLQAGTVDFTAAQPDCLQSVGGEGGYADPFDLSQGPDGGNGGPGIIQVHTGSVDQVRLPAGQSLADFSAPDAFQLLPFPVASAR